MRNRVAWGLAAVLAVMSGAWTRASLADNYTLEQRRLGPERTLISIRSRRTGQKVWTRSLCSPHLIQWAADGQALAIVDDRAGCWKHDWYFRLMLWQAGERVRLYDALRPFQRAEAVHDLRWSPDNHRLLFRVPYSQGEGDAGYGRLWCLRLRDGRTQLLADKAVTRAQWIDRTHVRYWTGQVLPRPTKPNEGILVETPHERTCR